MLGGEEPLIKATFRVFIFLIVVVGSLPLCLSFSSSLSLYLNFLPLFSPLFSSPPIYLFYSVLCSLTISISPAIAKPYLFASWVFASSLGKIGFFSLTHFLFSLIDRLLIFITLFDGIDSAKLGFGLLSILCFNRVKIVIKSIGLISIHCFIGEAIRKQTKVQLFYCFDQLKD